MVSSHGDSPAAQEEQTEEQIGATKTGQQQVKRTKRKKASRACFHCQKAHLTCDDSRPCQRCIKRGLGDTCQDGIRKKAKYLQDVDNQRAQAQQQLLYEDSASTGTPGSPCVSAVHGIFDVPAPEGTINPAIVARPVELSSRTHETPFPLLGDNMLFDYPPLSSYEFDSKAANMEYSMISTMLGGVPTPGADHCTSPEHMAFSSSSMVGYNRSQPSRQQTVTPDHNSVKSDSSWSQMPFAGAPAPINLPQAHTSSLSFPQGSTLHSTLPQPQHNGAAKGNGHSSVNSSPRLALSTANAAQNQANQVHAQHTRSLSTSAYTDPHGQRPTPVARRPVSLSSSEPGGIYKSITKPFSYTNGYHLLNTYLRARFEKQDLLRIARAIVGYRPSFIALTKTLREEDLVFMEVCFQRTLLEYEKFVGYSGTPTIIWRRTGQIELVGKEFCLLTQWSREQLLSKQTFIVELMDNSSVVEYFEKFSAHAFGDTSSVQTTCVLMTPSKRAVPCAFCFTIKRDVFDIPMMIVGNFLPVL